MVILIIKVVIIERINLIELIDNKSDENEKREYYNTNSIIVMRII